VLDALPALELKVKPEADIEGAEQLAKAPPVER